MGFVKKAVDKKKEQAKAAAKAKVKEAARKAHPQYCRATRSGRHEWGRTRVGEFHVIACKCGRLR